MCCVHYKDFTFVGHCFNAYTDDELEDIEEISSLFSCLSTKYSLKLANRMEEMA